MALTQALAHIVAFADARECSWSDRLRMRLVSKLCQTSAAFNRFIVAKFQTKLRVPRAPILTQIGGRHFPLFVHQISFGDRTKASIEITMTEADFSGAGLQASGATLLANFLPVCK